jgi:hypothetical protein
LIADQYRETIISALKEYDVANKITGRDDDEYEALSWAGLMETYAWNSFFNDINTHNLALKYLNIILFYKGNKEAWENTECGNNQ